MYLALAMVRGRHSDAAKYYRECLVIRQEIGDSKGTADSLTNISDLMREVLLPYDQIGRYGGEEFLIVLPGCDLPTAFMHAENLRTRVPAGLVRSTVSSASSSRPEIGIGRTNPSHSLNGRP